MQNYLRKKQLENFMLNQERWVESKDFLTNGEIAEKNLLHLKPLIPLGTL